MSDATLGKLSGRARHSVRAGPLLIHRRAEDCPPYHLSLAPCKEIATIRAWSCQSAKNCLMQFHNGWPRAVGSLSLSTACHGAKTSYAVHTQVRLCSLLCNSTTSDSSGIVDYVCLCLIICMPLSRSRANRECKSPSRTGRSSSLENVAWIGNAISLITGCAIIMNWKRKPATSS